MFNKLSLFLRPAGTSLVLVLSVHSAAHAGLVTGNWDPQFGGPLPDLSWLVQGTFNVPNLCSTQADGVYTTSSGPCSGSTIQTVDLKMFNTVTPGTQYTWNLGPSLIGSGGLTDVRVEAGAVVGFKTAWKAYPQSLICNYDPFTATCLSYFSLPSGAEGNLFSLELDVFGPKLICLQCRNLAQNVANTPGFADVASSTDGLNQFLVTYTSNNTEAPKFTDGNNNAAGARLNSAGQLQGLFTANGNPVSIPEPGTLTLALAALTAFGLSRRHRRTA